MTISDVMIMFASAFAVCIAAALGVYLLETLPARRDIRRRIEAAE